MNRGYPSNNEYPENYLVVNVIIRTKIKEAPFWSKQKTTAYWSGNLWVTKGDIKIGRGKVVEWEKIQEERKEK